MSKPVIAVWFSCGAASAVAAKLTIEKYGETHDIRVLNNPVLLCASASPSWSPAPSTLPPLPYWPSVSGRLQQRGGRQDMMMNMNTAN